MVRLVPHHWTETTHIDLTDIAAFRMGLSRSDRDILKKNVMVPDTWGLIEKIRHYMPLCSFVAEEITQEAIGMVHSGNDHQTGLAKLGHAMHFLQDSGNPWHTRPLLPLCQRNHTIYEEYVARNMRSGFRFRNALSNLPDRRCVDPKFARKIGEGATFLARHAMSQFAFLDMSIRTDPKWQEREDVATVTEGLLTACLKMCEIQIHAFSIRAECNDTRTIRLPVAVTWTFLGTDRLRLAI